MQTQTAIRRLLPAGIITAGVAVAAAALLLISLFGGRQQALGGTIDTSGVTCADVYLAELQAPLFPQPAPPTPTPTPTPYVILPTPIAKPVAVGDAPSASSIAVAMSLTYTKHDTSDDTARSAGVTYNSGIPGVIGGTLPFPLPATLRCAQYDKSVAVVNSQKTTPTPTRTPGGPTPTPGPTPAPGPKSTANVNVTPNGANPPLVDMIVFWNTTDAVARGFYRITAINGTNVDMKKTAPAACSGAPTSGFIAAPGELFACTTTNTGIDPIAFTNEDVTNVALDGDAPRSDFNACPNFATFTEGSCFNQGTNMSESLSCAVSTGKQEGGAQNAWTRTEIRVLANTDSSKKSPSYGIAQLFNPTAPNTCANIATTNRSSNLVVVWSLQSAELDGTDTSTWTSDYDMDGCKDWQELDQPLPQRLGSSPTFTGGRDPFNPNDCQTSLTGEWAAEIEAIPVTLDGSKNRIPGRLIHCVTVIEQSGASLTAPIYCYMDDTGITVNPQVAGTGSCPTAPAVQCGDGFSGAPYPVSTSGPPEGCYPFTGCMGYGDIDNPQSSFTGTYTPATDTFTLEGCLNNTEGTDIFIKAFGIDRMTGNGTVDVWLNRADCSDPLATLPTHNDVDIQMSKQARDVIAEPRYDYRENDYDHDGCSARQELGSTASQGGLRDPVNQQDHYDVNIVGGVWTPDGVINLPDDILGVAGQFGPTGDAPGITEAERAADKSPSMAGFAGSWNRGAGDGAVSLPDDVLGTSSQFGHNC